MLGLVVASLAVRLFVTWAPAALPRIDEVRLDFAALVGSVAITAVAMLLFAVAPALVTSRVEVTAVLRSGLRQGAGTRARRMTELLVIGQVALALVVLSGAGLLTRSFIRLRNAELSFDASHLAVGELAFRYDRYDTPDKQRAVLERVVPRIEALPGVRGASPVVAVPFSGTHGWDGQLAAEGQSPEQASANPMLNMEVVSPSYFATFGLDPLRGRVLSEDDRAGATPVVVISRSAARHFWPDEDPIGKRLTLGPPSDRHLLTVVGVVDDTRYRDLREARASIYFPIRQSFFPFMPTSLVISTDAPADDVATGLRRALEEEAPGVALESLAPMERFLEGPLAQPRLNALLLAVFAASSVALAAVGLFGVMALMVRRRTRELGVRMALGASTADVGRLVLRRGMSLAAAGTGVGLLGALAANRLLASLLFEVSPSDARTLGAVALLLLAVAAVASAIPAHASTRIEPAVALRAE